MRKMKDCNEVIKNKAWIMFRNGTLRRGKIITGFNKETKKQENYAVVDPSRDFSSTLMREV